MKGIYKIECLTTGVVYIGSTCVSFVKRWRKHRQRLRHDYHENSYLQNAWNKYGEDDFRFKIIEELNEKPESEIKKRESYWLAVYFPKGRDFCFNLSDHTCGGNTVKSKEAKKRLSESVKKSYTPELREVRKKQGELRSTELAELLEETITTDKWKKAHLEGVRKLAQDIEWLRKMKEVNKHRQIPVYTDKDEFFTSVAEASRQTGAFRSAIRACINGKIKSSMNRKWSYA